MRSHLVRHPVEGSKKPWKARAFQGFDMLCDGVPRRARDVRSCGKGRYPNQIWNFGT